MSKAPRRLTQGPIAPALLRLAWPVFVSHALHTLYGLADTAWVGRLGPEALGAVSASFFATWTLFAIGDLFTAGVTAMVSQAIGAGREDDAISAAVTGTVVATLAGVVVAVAGWFGSPLLFDLLLDDAETARLGGEYLAIFSLAAPALYLSFVAEALFRSCGDSRTPMLVMAVGTVLNIAVDPFVIYGIGPFPALGVQGAALATIGSEIVVFAIIAVLYFRRALPLDVRLSETPRRLSVARALRMTRIGLPTTAVGVIFSVGYLVLANFVGSFGPPALAALGIVNRLESLNYLAAIALGMAVATLVGQNLGAGQPDRAERSADRGAVLITAMTGALTLVYLIWPEPIVRIFTDDPDALREGTRFLRIIAISQVFMGWELVYGQAFTGAGDTTPPMWVGIVTSVLIRLPLAWWLAFHTDAGTNGIWWTISLTGIARGLWITVWFKLGGWKARTLAFDLDQAVPVAATPGPEGPEGGVR